jgi:hypothetical protein
MHLPLPKAAGVARLPLGSAIQYLKVAVPPPSHPPIPYRAHPCRPSPRISALSCPRLRATPSRSFPFPSLAAPSLFSCCSFPLVRSLCSSSSPPSLSPPPFSSLSLLSPPLLPLLFSSSSFASRKGSLTRGKQTRPVREAAPLESLLAVHSFPSKSFLDCAGLVSKEAAPKARYLIQHR